MVVIIWARIEKVLLEFVCLQAVLFIYVYIAFYRVYIGSVFYENASDNGVYF